MHPDTEMDKTRTRQSWRLQRAGPIVHPLTQWTVMAHAPLARRSSCMEHTCAGFTGVAG
jgi:hypothetical protein